MGPPPRRSATERREEPVRLRSAWRSAPPTCFVRPESQGVGCASLFHAALTLPPHAQIVVSRDYCEAARHCLLRETPFFRLGVLRNHSCSQPRAAFSFSNVMYILPFGRSSIHFGHLGQRMHHHRMCPPDVE